MHTDSHINRTMNSVNTQSLIANPFRLLPMLVAVTAAVMMINLLAWAIGEQIFLTDARQMDQQRATRQVGRINNFLEREALNLTRIFYGRGEWLVREFSERGRDWDAISFTEFADEDFMASVNIDGYLVLDATATARYAGTYSPVSGQVETLDKLDQSQLIALMKSAAQPGGFSGLQVRPDGRIALVAALPVGAGSPLGWVLARRDLDADQLQTYKELLDAEFSFDVVVPGTSPAEASGVLEIDPETDLVRWRLPALGDGFVLQLTMPYDHSYEQHMLATVATSRGVVFLLSLCTALFWLLLAHQRLLMRERAADSRRNLERVARLAAVGELAAGVAHEINNPSGMIQRNLDFVREVVEEALPLLAERPDAADLTLGGIDYATARQQLPQLLADMVNGSRRIGEIVRDLKDFSREEAPDEQTDFDLNEVSATAVRLLEGTLRKATDRFRFAPADRLPAVAGNQRQIEQVVLNLLQNACQALDCRDQAITVSTRHDAARKEIVLTVYDQGRGIAAQDLERIFEPFFTTRRESGGTGLGLSVSLRIVRRHGGTLEAVACPGPGTRMIMTLPVARSDR